MSLSGDRISFSVAGVANFEAMLSTNLGSMSPREQTDAIELCLNRAVSQFIGNYMKLRFMPYARSQLGYRITSRTTANKEMRRKLFADAVLPNVWRGHTREMVLNTAHVETRAIGGRTKGLVLAKIRMSTPEYVNHSANNKVTNDVIHKITAIEAGRIWELFKAEIIAVSARMGTVLIQKKRGVVERTTLASTDMSQVGMSSRQTLVNMRKTPQAAPRVA